MFRVAGLLVARVTLKLKKRLLKSRPSVSHSALVSSTRLVRSLQLNCSVDFGIASLSPHSLQHANRFFARTRPSQPHDPKTGEIGTTNLS